MGGILENWQQAGIAQLFSVQVFLCGLYWNLSRYSYVGRVARWLVRWHGQMCGVSPDTPGQDEMRHPDKENRDEVDQASLGLFGQWYLPIGRRLPAHRRPRWCFGRVRKPGAARRHLRNGGRRCRSHQRWTARSTFTAQCRGCPRPSSRSVRDVAGRAAFQLSKGAAQCLVLFSQRSVSP